MTLWHFQRRKFFFTLRTGVHCYDSDIDAILIYATSHRGIFSASYMVSSENRVTRVNILYPINSVSLFDEIPDPLSKFLFYYFPSGFHSATKFLRTILFIFTRCRNLIFKIWSYRVTLHQSIQEARLTFRAIRAKNVNYVHHVMLPLPWTTNGHVPVTLSFPLYPVSPP